MGQNNGDIQPENPSGRTIQIEEYRERVRPSCRVLICGARLLSRPVLGWVALADRENRVVLRVEKVTVRLELERGLVELANRPHGALRRRERRRDCEAGNDHPKNENPGLAATTHDSLAFRGHVYPSLKTGHIPDRRPREERHAGPLCARDSL